MNLRLWYFSISSHHQVKTVERNWRKVICGALNIYGGGLFCYSNIRMQISTTRKPSPMNTKYTRQFKRKQKRSQIFELFTFPRSLSLNIIFASVLQEVAAKNSWESSIWATKVYHLRIEVLFTHSFEGTFLKKTHATVRRLFKLSILKVILDDASINIGKAFSNFYSRYAFEYYYSYRQCTQSTHRFSPLVRNFSTYILFSTRLFFFLTPQSLSLVQNLRFFQPSFLLTSAPQHVLKSYIFCWRIFPAHPYSSCVNSRV